MTTPDQGGGGSRPGGNEQGGTTASRRLTTPAGIHAFLRRPSGRPPFRCLLKTRTMPENGTGAAREGGDCGG